MFRIMGFFLVFMALLLDVSCKRKCDCYSNVDRVVQKKEGALPWSVHKINMEGFLTLLKRVRHNEMFGFHTIPLNGSEAIVFLSADSRLFSIDIASGKVLDSLNLISILPQNDYYGVLIQKDTIHLLNQNRSIYYKYKMRFKESTFLIDSFNLGNRKEFDNCVTNLLIGRPAITYKWPFAWVQYSNLKKNNGLDNNAYIKINFLKKTIDKIIAYPECYKCCYQYLATSSLVVSPNGETITLFDYYDKLFVDLDGKRKGIFELTHDCRMRKYEESKSENLAYTRRYLENEEVNMGLFLLQNENLVAVKRNYKQSLSDLPTYSIFLFDSGHKLLFEKNIDHDLAGVPIIVPYKNGLLMINKKYNQGYYYAFEK
ncbi:MAG: hypothetical protein J0L56_03435 [Chitinophagales bacterium]|nr:hypothetical protein [Chitinophagales bacterium]